MDELTLLRSIRDEEVADPAAIRAGRQVLSRHLEQTDLTETAAGSQRARRLSSAVLLVAAAVTVAVMVAFVGGRSGTESAAAAVFHDAAKTTITTSDPVVADGQYLKVATTGVYAAGTSQPNGGLVTYLTSSDGQVYIPSDRGGEWVWVRDAEKAVQTFGPASERAAAADAVDRSPGEYLTAAGGAFYGNPVSPSPAELAALPQEPGALLDRIYALSGGNTRETSKEAEALGWIADTLRTGLVDADLRAALYEAAAEIPGVEVVDRAATLDGRSGIAVGHTDDGGVRQDLIIDPKTGLLIGERRVVTGRAAATWAVPEGIAIEWTAIRTTVVDTVPDPGRR